MQSQIFRHTLRHRLVHLGSSLQIPRLSSDHYIKMRSRLWKRNMPVNAYVPKPQASNRHPLEPNERVLAVYFEHLPTVCQIHVHRIHLIREDWTTCHALLESEMM